MSIDIADLSSTIVPKSDQLNAEQLLSGPVTVTVTDVRVGSGDEQPVTIHYEGENGRPYKPCKTCRKILIFAWGADGREWIGRSMTLYNETSVRFGGAEVGGIRISHLTDIAKDISVALTATRGKKSTHTIKRIDGGAVAKAQAERERLAAIQVAGFDAADKGMPALVTFWTALSKSDKAHFAAMKDSEWKPRAETADTTGRLAA